MSTTRIAIIDLPNVFWTFAKPRAKDESVANLTLMVFERLKKLTGDNDVVVFADDVKPYWRSRVHGEYKANRPPKDPKHITEFEHLKSVLTKCEFTVASARENEPYWFEADDVIASWAKWANTQVWDVSVFSNDWDLAQILGVMPQVHLFDADGVERTSETVREKFGVSPNKLVDFKALAGDDTDNYKFFPLIGEKTAARLIDTFGSAAEAIKAAEEGKSFERFQDRVPAILKQNAKHLGVAAECATLRYDAPLPPTIDVGEFDDVEKLLRAHMVEVKKRELEEALAAMSNPAPEAPKQEKPESVGIEVAGPLKPQRRTRTRTRAAESPPAPPPEPPNVESEGVPHDPDDHGGTPHDDDDPQAASVIDERNDPRDLFVFVAEKDERTVGQIEEASASGEEPNRSARPGRASARDLEPRSHAELVASDPRDGLSDLELLQRLVLVDEATYCEFAKVAFAMMWARAFIALDYRMRLDAIVETMRTAQPVVHRSRKLFAFFAPPHVRDDVSVFEDMLSAKQTGAGPIDPESFLAALDDVYSVVCGIPKIPRLSTPGVNTAG